MTVSAHRYGRPLAIAAGIAATWWLFSNHPVLTLLLLAVGIYGAALRHEHKAGRPYPGSGLFASMPAQMDAYRSAKCSAEPTPSTAAESVRDEHAATIIADLRAELAYTNRLLDEERSVVAMLTDQFTPEEADQADEEH